MFNQLKFSGYFLFVLLVTAGCQDKTKEGYTDSSLWTLVWSDEFDYESIWTTDITIRSGTTVPDINPGHSTNGSTC